MTQTQTPPATDTSGVQSRPYIVSARKYRPATFRTVVGQKALTATLKNAVASGRLAQAYLFCGPRGVGKTSCARIFAKAINCLNPTEDGEACGVCESCRAIDAGTSFNVTELDAASNNSVNDIRNLTDQVSQRPQGGGKYRVFIIDEVHMLSSAAFNAFLKTLEEPPAHVIFILATTEKHKVIPTVLSRCQTYDFKRITLQDMVDHLAYVAAEEGIEAETSALGVIARKADGAMRDALSIFDQVAASSQGHITYQSTIDNLNVLDSEYYFKLVDAFREGRVGDALLIFADIRARGFDPLFFVNGLASHIRDLMMAADTRTLSLLEAPDDMAQRFAQQAATLPLQWHYAAMKILSDTDIQYRTSGNRLLLVELALIRLCQLLTPPQPPFDRIDDPIPLADPVTLSNQPSITHTQSPTQPQGTASATPQTTATAMAQAHTHTPAEPPAVDKTVTPAQSSLAVQNPAPRRRTPKRTATLKISDPEALAATSTLETHHEPVTEQSLATAWQEFMDAHPDLHILISAMRTSVPVSTGEDTFTCTVSHPAQAQAFDSAMPKLMQFLRERLRNDKIVINVVTDTSREPDRTLPPKEFLKKAVEANPQLGLLLDTLDAELIG